MHFLSHYYVELPQNTPLFVAGLGIPDLVTGFSRTYNSVIKNSVLTIDEELEQIQKGILSHYAADKRFHNSQLFMQQVTLVTQSLVNEGLDRKKLRLSVLAHIAIEMMIDRQILLQHEKVCIDFYNSIERADEKVLNTYLSLFLTEKEVTIFLSKFQFFKQRRFLFLFKELEHIVFGLNRVYSNVTQTEMTNEDKAGFLSVLNNIDGQMRYSWKEILKA